MAVDPLQQRDQAGLDWQGGRLGQAGVPRTTGFGGATDGRVFPEVRGGDRGGDRKKLGLCNAKDLEVSRLPETVNREQFILWCDGLDECLENCPGWTSRRRHSRR